MPSSITGLIQDKQSRLETVPQRLAEQVSRAQMSIFADVLALLEQLERDENGIILPSQKNIDLLNTIRPQLQRILIQSEYAQAVKSFSDEFDKQADLNAELYSQSVDYVESQITTNLINTAKRSAMESLIGGALDSAFYNPVIDIINNSISTGSGFVETVKALRLAIVGGEANGTITDGKLSRYVKQIASDAFAIADRTYNNQVSQELQLEFYAYVGGIIDDTRDFCKVRNGKYFHEKEVESWINGGGDHAGNPEPNVEWQGQYRGTNDGTIFNLCGGYNCKHTLMPVSITGVPIDVIQRNLSSGNIKLTEKQKQILGV